MFSTTEREIKDWVSEVAEALDVVIPDDRLVTRGFTVRERDCLPQPPPENLPSYAPLPLIYVYVPVVI